LRSPANKTGNPPLRHSESSDPIRVVRARGRPPLISLVWLPTLVVWQ
jgi:hypothetical protein